MERAEPVVSSTSKITEQRRGEFAAGSKREGKPVRKRDRDESVCIPMTDSYDPVMPTSEM